MAEQSSIPKRSLLRGHGESILSNQYSVLTASGRTEQLSLRTAIDNFMLENFPEFKTESFSIPSEIVDYSGKTGIQAPLFPDVVAKALDSQVQGHRKNVTGAQEEAAVFDFIQRSAKALSRRALSSWQHLLGLNKKC